MPETETLALREQFATPEQQRGTASAGMWIFLATEVMLFGALFTAFTIYRSSYTQAFDVGSGEMDLWLGALNTGVLICSSFTMALAVHSAETGKQRLLSMFLLATMIIGAVFLGIKFTEYYKHYQEHKVPGVWFEQSGSNPSNVQMFFVFYFVMTGLHAVHMTIGLSILFVLWVRSLLGAFTAEYYTPIEMGGLYWHFIDIVWVFLYAIFYVPGLHMHS